MSIDFNARTIYCKLTYDAETKKKNTYFGGSWGSMEKRDANAVAFKTGDGLVVVDVDTQDLTEIDKGIRRELEKLGKPTVTTARGYHWYFEHKNSPEFVNKASYSKLVDVRSDGGIIFSQYKGGSPHISYKRTGDVFSKMPKKLHRLLKDAMQSSTKKVKQRTQWEKIPKGEIHDGMLRYIMKDFYAGLAYDEVIANGVDYVQRFLGGTQREINLMMERVKWGFDKRLENKLDEQKVVPPSEQSSGSGDFEDDEVVSMLLSAEKGGAQELERVMKEIKKKLGVSLGTQREILKEARLSKSGGIAIHFKGDVVWDSHMEKFVEIREDSETYYKKQSFNQTVMSRSGFLENADVNELLPTVPAKHIIYIPTKDRGDMLDEFGEDAFNVHNSVVFKGKGKKIPKTIAKVLDNLFESDMEAREVFINWMATIVQTGMRTGVAWGFFGASGTGKTLIAEIMRDLVGGKNASMNVSDNDLQSAFSPYLLHKQFLHLNEVASDFHGRHGVAGHIKAFVSDAHIRINMKFMGEVEVDNYINVILNSNKSNPLELDVDDRRWNMIMTSNALVNTSWWKGNKSYAKVLKEIDELGAYLTNYKIDKGQACTPMKMSLAKQNVVEQTSSTTQMLGKHIRIGDAPALVDMLDIDESSLDFTEDEIIWSCDHGKWSNELLLRLYIWATRKEGSTVYECKKYFTMPYVSKEVLSFKRDNKTYRGVEV